MPFREAVGFGREVIYVDATGMGRKAGGAGVGDHRVGSASGKRVMRGGG